jgi:hypothetical protein
MPLGQRLAHMRPERCLSIFDLLRQALVDAGDGRFELEAGVIGGTASTLPGHVTKDEPEGTQTVTFEVNVIVSPYVASKTRVPRDAWSIDQAMMAFS